MKKVLVIGCKGMAGHVIKSYLEGLHIYDVMGIARNVNSEENLFSMDVNDTNKFEQVIIQNSFDVIINCIGLLNETAEKNPELAIWCNSYFPHLLSKLGSKYGFKLIHISTDCVFSGEEGSYTEDSFRNGKGFYAQSKALGEVINSNDLTFRTSIIGPELKQNGIGLFNWFMNEGNEISGFSKAIWTGVTTVELAKAIDKAIVDDLTGLYHLVNNTKISKYELLNLINKVFDKNIEIVENAHYFSDKSLINTRKDFDFRVLSYKDMIEEMKVWVSDHGFYYQNNY